MGDLIKFGVKVAGVVSVALIFATAITTIINFLVNISGASLIREVIGLISCCLPFDASAVFGGIYGIMVSILGFLVARKIFNLTMDGLSATS